MTQICIYKQTIIGSDNSLFPGQCQAIIWTNIGILLIGLLGTNFSEIFIKIQTSSLKKICLKMLSANCYPFRLGPNVLSTWGCIIPTSRMILSSIHWSPGRRGSNPKSITLKHTLLIKFMKISPEIALSWILQGIVDKSTSVQVMAWCCQAARHYLCQCWPRFMSQHSITRTQWINSLCPSDIILDHNNGQPFVLMALAITSRNINSLDARDRKFRLWESIPCLATLGASASAGMALAV